MTDRDSHRFGDPLHDTVDETSGVVSGEINPDTTPLHVVIDSIEADVGPLTSRERAQWTAYLQHEKRVRQRAANARMAGSRGVDVDAIKRDLREDMAGWQPFAEMKKAIDACEQERISREKRAKWLNPIRNVGIGGLIAALLWTVRALDQRGADSERTRQRNEQVERALLDVRELQDWRIRADTLLGLRARFPRPTEPDRGDP